MSTFKKRKADGDNDQLPSKSHNKSKFFLHQQATDTFLMKLKFITTSNVFLNRASFNNR
jgi:hypothetical protein